MEMKFYKCDVCGAIIMNLQGETHALSCCGKQMNLLKANSSDGASEKHVPVIKEKIKDCKMAGASIYDVQIGSVEHPMLPEHLINWIGMFNQDTWVIKWLKPGDKPKQHFKITNDSQLYEYCNLHGLWKK